VATPAVTRLRRIATWIGAGLAGLALGGFLFAWSGIYNVAASRGHWKAVEWMLEFGMKNSVERRAWSIEVPSLDDPDLIALGAAHFHRACSSCHGAPGIRPDLVAQRALPPPPDLTHVSRGWNDRELFWIVKHGIKYTGMPAWPALERDDEVWSVVAFLRRLPLIDHAEYRRLATGGVGSVAQSGRDLARGGVTDLPTGACARCHGDEGQRPSSALVPILHGQSREFLAAALHNYASGRRSSGIMQPIAAELTAETVAKLASYYASLDLPAPAAEASVIGRDLATHGDAAARIPACTGCHDAQALPLYPRLAGQNAAYMANRLRLWKQGLAPSTDTESVMAPIARLLSDEQIADVSAFFAGQSPNTNRPP
jgi:cytochrome c553